MEPNAKKIATNNLFFRGELNKGLLVSLTSLYFNHKYPVSLSFEKCFVMERLMVSKLRSICCY